MSYRIWEPQELAPRTNCPVCDARAEGPVLALRWDGLSLRRCIACALLFVDPVPTSAALARCYGPDYFRSSIYRSRIGPDRDYRDISDHDIRAGQIEGRATLTDNFDLRGKSILEIGCATGALLQSLRQLHPQRLVGIDIASEPIEFGRKRYGLDLRSLTLEDARFGDAEFDLIVAFDVIEHVDNIRTFLAQAVRSVKPGGAIVLRTPNGDSLAPSGRRWTYLHYGLEHVVYLSPRTLKYLADQQKLTIEKLWSDGCPAYVPYRRQERWRIFKMIREPVNFFRNTFDRWRLHALARKNQGLDFVAILRS